MNIETGVPIPPVDRRRQPGSPFTKMIRQLEIGQSVLLDSETQSDHARKVIKKMGWQYTRRKTRDGWRVWRVA